MKEPDTLAIEQATNLDDVRNRAKNQQLIADLKKQAAEQRKAVDEWWGKQTSTVKINWLTAYAAEKTMIVKPVEYVNCSKCQGKGVTGGTNLCLRCLGSAGTGSSSTSRDFLFVRGLAALRHLRRSLGGLRRVDVPIVRRDEQRHLQVLRRLRRRRSKSPEENTCSRCRMPNPPGAKFCNQCGGRLGTRAWEDEGKERRVVTVLLRTSAGSLSSRSGWTEEVEERIRACWARLSR